MIKVENQFKEIKDLIRKAKEKTLHLVNTELIDLYWNIGNYISKSIDTSEWVNSVVNKLAKYLKSTEPDMKGFSSQNLWRMKQFYDTYSKNKKLSSLVREISWTNNLIILSKYQTKLIDKKVLESKLDEFFKLAEPKLEYVKSTR